MHWTSMDGMRRRLGKYLMARIDEKLTLVDLGSQCVGGNQVGWTYRGLMPPSWKYVGVDMSAGDNVDMVMTSEFSIPIPDNSIDVLISGQCIEHCRNPFRLVLEAARIIKPGSLMLLTAPACWNEHRFPVDCFRYYPDGMRAIMEEAGLDVLEAVLEGETNIGGPNPVGHDCWGVGRKK